MLELFDDRFHFFKFLSMSNKPPGPAKNYHCYSYIVQASLNCSICTRKGKYPEVKANANFHQLTKHAEISYSTASLVLCKFLSETYRNGLSQGLPRLKHSRYLKKYELC